MVPITVCNVALQARKALVAVTEVLNMHNRTDVVQSTSPRNEALEMAMGIRLVVDLLLDEVLALVVDLARDVDLVRDVDRADQDVVWMIAAHVVKSTAGLDPEARDAWGQNAATGLQLVGQDEDVQTKRETKKVVVATVVQAPIAQLSP